MLRMVYASRKADPLLLKQIDINGDGEVSMEELQQTVEEDNSVLAPAFQLQRMLRQRILGVRYWEQETLRRQTYFAGYDSGTTTSWDAIRDILAIKHRERLEEEERQRQKIEQNSSIDIEDEDNHTGNVNDSNEKSREKIDEKNIAMSSANVGVDNPLSRMELLDWLESFAKENHCAADLKYDRIPFGFCGFPNVGKSSVINVLMGNAKNAHGVVRVGVAAQPGKTKHFQTLLLPDRANMLLCDCPGLVFPSFVSNTADLIAAGVYPIAQMRDWKPVMELGSSRKCSLLITVLAL